MTTLPSTAPPYVRARWYAEHPAPAVAVTERLGITPVTFPGDHGGFLGGEYGSTGQPDAFAATVREVLDG